MNRKKPVKSNRLRDLKSVALAILAKRELARRHIIPYAQQVAPNFIVNPFNQFIFECVEKSINREPGWTRLIFAAPPQHGKTFAISEISSSCYRAKFPNDPIILTSYSDTLASRASRHARNFINSDSFKLIFPDIKLDTEAVGSWELAKPYTGEFHASGIMGSVTGHGAMLLIIDDPIKNRQEAESEVYQNNLIDAWKSSLSTRLHENGLVWVILTRWGENDIANWLLKYSGMGFRYIRIPALCDSENDPLGRQIGEALWSEKWSAEYLLEKKAMMGDYEFNALYQGAPVPRQGLLFKRDGFEIIDERPEGLRWTRGWDLAATTKTQSHYTAGIQAAQRGVDIVLDGHIMGKWEWGEVRGIIKETAMSEPDVMVGIEAQGTQVGMSQEICIDPELMGIGIIPVHVSTDKRTRANPLIAASYNNRLKLVRGEWNEGFINRCIAFDKGEVDDDIDAASIAVKLLGMVNVGTAVSLKELLAEEDAKKEEQEKLANLESKMTAGSVKSVEVSQDLILKKAKEQGYVPEGCYMDGELVMALVNSGYNPCDGCNADRSICHGGQLEETNNIVAGSAVDLNRV